MKFQLTAFILTAILAPLVLCGKKTEATWRKLLKDHADCVTWVSATVRVEVSAGGRTCPAGAKTGGSRHDHRRGRPYRSVLSRVDPRLPCFPHTHSGRFGNVNYTEVLLSCRMGRKCPPSCCSRTPTWTWLTFCQSRKRVKNTKTDFFTSPFIQNQRPSAFGRGRIFGQTGEKPLQTINLEKGWVNAVIEKPRKYFVIENTAPGTPVFDKEANWLGIVVYKMDRGRPTSIVTLPADDIDEIAEQVRSRNQ